MAYNANIPLAGDLLSQSQNDILNNFTAIGTWVAINHVTFDAVNQGKHYFVEFPVNAVAPVPVAGEVGLYSQTSTLTGNPELVFAHQLGLDPVEFTSAVKNAATGYAILPSGIIFKWGYSVVMAAAYKTVSFAIGAGIPVFTEVYNIQVSRRGSPTDTGILYVYGNTLADLTVYNTADSPKTFYYFVTGV